MAVPIKKKEKSVNTNNSVVPQVQVVKKEVIVVSFRFTCSFNLYFDAAASLDLKTAAYQSANE
jgi:hypothetical protein